MTISLEFWQLVTLLMAFFGFVVGAAKMLFGQIDRRLNEKFAALEQARQSADQAMREELFRHAREEEKAFSKLDVLERDVMSWRAEMPLQYVRREDYIRGQTILEAKMDAVYSKLEVVRLEGARNA